MKYATFPRGIWLTFYKTCSFHNILQWNLTFSLLTWLGSPIFLFYLLVRTDNFLWVVFNKIWMIRFLLWWIIWFENFHFVVFCTQMSSQILSFYTFNQFENSLYFMKHDPEVKYFIPIVTLKFIIHKKRLISRVAVNFVDQTRYCTSINHFVTPL